MSKIYFVLGKSCSGKDTIFRYLKENTELNLKTVVGYTTRPMRKNEKDGVEYFFVSKERLEKLKNHGKIIECRNYNTVYGVWNYFTVDDGEIINSTTDEKGNANLLLNFDKGTHTVKYVFNETGFNPISSSSKILLILEFIISREVNVSSNSSSPIILRRVVAVKFSIALIGLSTP